MLAFVPLLVLLLAQGTLALYESYVRMEPAVQTFSSKKWLALDKQTITSNNLVLEDYEIKMIFVLKHDQRAVSAFEKELLELATPGNKKYGQWLKHDDIKSRLAPSSDRVKVVTDYLESFGVKGEAVRVSRFNDMVHVKVPIKVANDLLKTEFTLFRSMQQKNLLLPRITKPYYLPVEVASVVNIVDDIMRFPALRDAPRSFSESMFSVNNASEEKKKLAVSSKGDTVFESCGSQCSGLTTPDVLKSAYSVGSVSSVASGNSMSVAEFQYQYYDNTDLKAFSSACGVTATVDTTIGGNIEKICELGGCVEALLDIEYIEAIANPIPLTVIYSASYSLLDWVDQVMSMDNPPLVHSVSYGNDEVQQTSTEYMESVNEQFMAAGAMGLSILFAAGDQGVWGRSGVGKTFHPDFPAGSPYVTSVGGTDFSTKSTVGAESAWSCGGGGFSDTFSRPSWQDSVVSSYLTNAQSQGVLPDSSFFNSTGRAYPDVSALGGQVNPYCVAYSGGKFGGVAGTSASCPVVAGIFAQLNNVRLSNNKSALGWLNPFIYTTGVSACFNDVNDGSQNNCKATTTGFAALDGWDPATGFGSPNYSCLENVVLNF